MRALRTAASGMAAQQLNVEVISNNIANISTTGYKRNRAEFQDLLYQSVRRVGSESSDAGNIVPTGVQVGLGVKAAAVYRINEQGNLQQTENRFDLAIRGNGYFQVTLPSGETAYTRAGSFQLNPQGELVTADGYRITGPNAVPANTREITVNASGEMLALVDGQVDPQSLGQLSLASFANEAGLEAIGDNLYLETPASGNAVEGTPDSAGYGTIRQGMLETSNVNIVSEITQLITAQRAYEMNSKVITTTDEMMRSISTLR
jgi:flagellar basal-body rod protein FlgG